MPFAKSKTPDRTSLQRLGDQRHKVALAGLAAGAAVAAVFRRKKSGGATEFGRPLPVAGPPEPVAPSAPESGPPAEAEVPPAASEPEIPPASGGPKTPSAAPEAPAPAAERPSTSISDPATGELSAEEASILAVLAQSGRADDDRTAIAVATSLERETADVTTVLRKLGAEGVVSGELFTAAGDKIWAVTERGVRRLGAQH
jgi:hypothetical protein